MHFERDKLKESMVLHIRSYGKFGRLIRRVLKKAWGNHDALLIKKDDEWFTGDSEPLFAKLKPLDYYEKRMGAGELEVKVYDIVGARPADRKRAADYWVDNVLGTFYDFLAFPRLWFKAVIGDWWGKAAGWEWAHWCTEGVADSWDKGAQLSVWNKTNPTPYTTEKRVGFTLKDVTNEVIKMDSVSEVR